MYAISYLHLGKRKSEELETERCKLSGRFGDLVSEVSVKLLEDPEIFFFSTTDSGNTNLGTEDIVP